MKNINGFINVKDYLTDDSINYKIYTEDKGFIKLNDNNLYFYKRCHKDLCYREIIGHEIAKYLNIPSVNYKLALIPNLSGNYDLGIISKSYHKAPNIYISGYDILKDYFQYIGEWDDLGHVNNNAYFNNLECIWNALEHHYRFDKNKFYKVSKIMYQIIYNIFLYDIFLTNADRNYNNWEIEEDENNANITFLFDNEDILREYSNTPCMPINYINRKNNWCENLKEFLKLSSDLYIKMVENIFINLTPNKLNELISTVEINLGSIPLSTKNQMIKKYQEHYLNLSNLIKENDRFFYKRVKIK